MYNWQQKDWTKFKYNLAEIEHLLFDFAERTGRITGFLKGLPEDAQTEAIIDIMVSEAIKTSEIEGEYISRKDVVSSIRKNLGLIKDTEQVRDKTAQGVAELMIDVRNSFAEELTFEKLFSWHKMVMKGNKKINAGVWRSHEEPMQVVSGTLGKEKIHFEAPPSSRIPEEMHHFIQWFNDTAPGEKKEILQPVVRSAIAHLYFETIHPFEDGNGRIGRAISEKALSQSAKRPILLSLSRSIENKKKEYYDALQKAQRSNEIAAWITYFIHVALDAQIQAEQQIEFTLKKTKFFDHFKDQLNERQLKIVKRIFEEGAQGFEGGINTKKYISITKTSKATATRDLQHMVEMGILTPIGKGRSTRYEMKLDV